ncbi:hypothetical protein OG792_32770 [Micromonospora sp. NBC_01699]|uniref:hypothetical protein n=1 Tax=Micromonospora sp. NBC_01699 TaxID=2975984 RepID=UPI002E2CD5B6|nr:hypothetical protein [Micromonospora sp. NBC_01699]
MHNTTVRALWLAVAVLAAAFIGAAAGVISWAGTRKTGSAVLVGGAAFAGALGLALAAIEFVDPSA